MVQTGNEGFLKQAGPSSITHRWDLDIPAPEAVHEVSEEVLEKALQHLT